VISNNTLSSGAPGSDTAATGHGGDASEVDGGGIIIGNAGATSITGSTFSGNHLRLAPPGAGAGGTSGLGAAANGGALAIDVPATIVNTTISGNTAQSQSGPASGEDSEGGGIAFVTPTGTLGLYSDTIAGNTAQASPAIQMAGANVGSGGGTVTLQDTAIASPLPSGAPNCFPTPGGPFTDNGHNLEDTATSSCGLTAGHNDVIGASPQLPSTVGANGGTTGPTDPTTHYVGTFTLAPAAGSPLIGAGGQCINPLAAGSPPLTVDQRGFARPATCDIGAFQTQPVKVTGAPVITSTPAVGNTLTCSTGTFAATGDGTLTATGSIGALALSYAWTSGTSTVATTSTYKVAASEAGHSITCTETATGAYGKASATSPAVTRPTARSPQRRAHGGQPGAQVVGREEAQAQGVDRDQLQVHPQRGRDRQVHVHHDAQGTQGQAQVRRPDQAQQARPEVHEDDHRRDDDGGRPRRPQHQAVFGQDRPPFLGAGRLQAHGLGYQRLDPQQQDAEVHDRRLKPFPRAANSPRPA
jgi:hypothetical protein